MHTDYLQHHDILGQKWGIRRYQNDDGTLTEKGKDRIRKKYDRSETALKLSKKYNEEQVKSVQKKQKKLSANGTGDDEVLKRYNKLQRDINFGDDFTRGRAIEKEMRYDSEGLDLSNIYSSKSERVRNGIKKEYETELKNLEKKYVESGKKASDKLDKFMSINVNDLIESGDYRRARQTIRDARDY